MRVQDRHLALRALAGPLRKGARLYPTDPRDPLAFQALIEGRAFPVVFGRDLEEGSVDRLCVGLDCLAKRSRAKSLRLRVQAGAGTLAGVAIAAAAWKGPDAREPRSAPEVREPVRVVDSSYPPSSTDFVTIRAGTTVPARCPRALRPPAR